MTAPEGTAGGQAARPEPVARGALEAIIRHSVTENRDCRGALPCGHCERRITEAMAAVDAYAEAVAAAAAAQPAQLDVRHWDGYPTTATVLIDWILASGGTARYHDGPSAIVIDVEQRHTLIAVPGDWIVRLPNGAFRVLAAKLREAAAQGAGGDLVASLRDLAGHWEREYVSYENWPQQCARELTRLLDKAAQAGEQPAPAAAPDPDLDDSLSKHIAVRFDPATIEAVKHIASAEGMTVSAWVRREVEREATRREAAAAPGIPRAAVQQLLADVTRSADATRPSKKTQIEDELAAQLRQLLEPS